MIRGEMRSFSLLCLAMGLPVASSQCLPGSIPPYGVDILDIAYGASQGICSPPSPPSLPAAVIEYISGGQVIDGPGYVAGGTITQLGGGCTGAGLKRIEIDATFTSGGSFTYASDLMVLAFQADDPNPGVGTEVFRFGGYTTALVAAPQIQWPASCNGATTADIQFTCAIDVPDIPSFSSETLTDFFLGAGNGWATGPVGATWILNSLTLVMGEVMGDGASCAPPPPAPPQLPPLTELDITYGFYSAALTFPSQFSRYGPYDSCGPVVEGVTAMKLTYYNEANGVTGAGNIDQLYDNTAIVVSTPGGVSTCAGILGFFGGNPEPLEAFCGVNFAPWAPWDGTAQTCTGFSTAFGDYFECGVVVDDANLFPTQEFEIYFMYFGDPVEPVTIGYVYKFDFSILATTCESQQKEEQSMQVRLVPWQELIKKKYPEHK